MQLMTFGTLTHPTAQFFQGNVAVVEYLMKSGASVCVHMQDRNHDTPLLSAIKVRFFKKQLTLTNSSLSRLGFFQIYLNKRAQQWKE